MISSKKLVFIFSIGLMISTYEISYAQHREHEFNVPGSNCHIKLVSYSPNNNYRSIKRPYVFVLGESGSTGLETFQSDTLKDMPRFYRYNFVYLPNNGGTTQDKLPCIYDFVNYYTWEYACGHSNVFLYSYDSSIKDYNYLTEGASRVFESVRLASAHTNPSEHDSLVSLVNDFKEVTAEYYQETIINENDLGTYYFEEDTYNEDRFAASVSEKTYFGPPQAHDFTLSGIIKDKTTGETLPFATIAIKGTSNGISTNADGYFTLSKVPSDTSVLVVSYVGYTTTEVFLDPSKPKKYFIIEISPSHNLLKGVTVVGVREDVVLAKKEELGVVKLTPKQIEKLPSLGEKDVMRSLQLLPGVSASQESSSGLYVRGGTPDQNLILYDGFTVYHVDHLYGFFSAFNSNALKDVQLYKGGFESRFGGRLSSVTELTGKEGNQKQFNFGGDLSLLSINGYAEIPIGKKFSSIVAFRRSYKGPIYNKLFEQFNANESATTNSTIGGPPGGGGRTVQASTVSNYFYDLNGKFTYRPNDKDILSLSIFNGTDKLDNSDSFEAPSFGNSNSNFSSNSTDLTRYGNIGSSLKWSRKWADRLYSNTILSYSNYYSERERSQERTSIDDNSDTTTISNGIFESNNLKDYSVKSDYQWDPVSFSQLQFGVFGTLYDIDYTYAQNDTTTILDKHNQDILAGVYLQNKFKLFNQKLIILPGIRASYYGATKLIYYEPRASLSLSITERLTLKGATGKYYQFANRVTREDILSGSKDFWLLSDGNSVPVSSSIHYMAGLSYETLDYLFSVEGYYKEIKDITEYSLRFNPSPMGVSYDENFFSGYGYSKGIELLAQKKAGKLNGWLSYTLGEARSHFDVYSDSYFPANQDVTHEFKVVAMYEYKRWNFSSTWVYATGRPYTAPSGAYNVELLDGSTQNFFTVTSKNGLRLPDYHRADISANYKLLAGQSGDKKRREIGYLGFSIFNLYNRTNVWYRTYAIEDGSVIETNVNYTGITPNITLSLKLR